MTQLRPLLLTLTLLGSAAAQPAHPTLTLPRNVPAPLSRATKSLPLSEVFSPSAATANCLGNAFEMPGQAWHTDLTGGGISLGTQGLDARPPTFEGLYGFAPSRLDSRAADSEILVIDKFTPAPLNILSGQGSETLMLSHGSLVEAHLRALLESAGFALRSTKPLVYAREGRTVTLRRLDLAQVYRTKSIAGPALTPSAALAQALQQQLDSESKAIRPKDLVLNMSFAMIPCQVMTTYRETRDHWARATPPQRYNFNTFLNHVATASKLTGSEVQRELTTVSDTEPLKRVITQYAQEKRARGASFNAVASSGNFGLGYPTAPAAFGDVISAGMHTWQGKPATDVDGHIWPDAADVNVAGEWFTLSAANLRRYCQQGGSCITPDVLSNPQHYAAFAYRGTSFAAPTLSLFLALQQGPSNGCFGKEGIGYSAIQKSPSTQKPFDFAAAWAKCEKSPAEGTLTPF